MTNEEGADDSLADILTCLKSGDHGHPQTDGVGVKRSDEICGSVVDAHIETTRNIRNQRHAEFDDIGFSVESGCSGPDVDIEMRTSSELRDQDTNVKGKKFAEGRANTDP